MVVKINSKPVHVTENDEDKGIDWLYVSVSTMGYTFLLWFLDYVCYTFFYIRAIPGIHWIGDILSWIF